MTIRWSFLNGFIALPSGYAEVVVWFALRWWQMDLSYKVVPEIWMERSFPSMLAYGVGQFVFISWPILLYKVGLISVSAGDRKSVV